MAQRKLNRVILDNSSGTAVFATGLTVALYTDEGVPQLVSTATETPALSGNYEVTWTTVLKYGYWYVGVTKKDNWGRLWLGDLSDIDAWGINKLTTNNGLDVNGNAIVTGTLDTTGVVTLGQSGASDGIINAPDSIYMNIDSNGDQSGEVFVIGHNRQSGAGSGNLFIVSESGATIVSGTLATTQSVSIRKASSNATGLDVNGNTIISGSLITSGSLDVKNNLTLTGSLLMSGTFDIKSNVVISGSLIVTSSITSQNTGTFNGGLNIGDTTKVDFGQSTGMKLDLYNGAYGIGIDPYILYYDADKGSAISSHIFRTNNAQRLQIGSILSASSNLVMSGNLAIHSENYVPGQLGKGFKIQNNAISSSMELDNLTVRGALSVNVFRINETHVSNGTLVITDGASVGYETGSTGLFIARVSGSATFVPNDLIWYKKLDANNNVSEVKAQVTAKFTASLNSILYDRYTLSFTAGGYSNFKVGGAVVRIGNTSDTTRQGFLALDASNTVAGGPTYNVYDGVNSWTTFGTFPTLKARLGYLEDVSSSMGYGIYTNNGWFSGSIYATDGTFSGSVNAGGGVIGGWEIQPTKIVKGHTLAGNGSHSLQISSTTSAGAANWYIDNSPLEGYGLKWWQNFNAGWLTLGQLTSNASTGVKTGYYGLQMMDYLGNEFFALSANTTQSYASTAAYNTATSSVGIYNRIAGWKFDQEKIYNGTLELNVSSSTITGGTLRTSGGGTTRVEMNGGSGSIQTIYASGGVDLYKNSITPYYTSGKMWTKFDLQHVDVGLWVQDIPDADGTRYAKVATRFVGAYWYDATGSLHSAEVNATDSALNINAVKVVGSRKTGWGTPTGTLYRSALSDSSTQPEVNRALMALITDLVSHGLIGA